MKKTMHFENRPGASQLINRLVKSGFKKFGPVMSSHNGYHLEINGLINHRLISFYDNRIYNNQKMDIQITDSGQVPVYKKGIFGIMFWAPPKARGVIYHRSFDMCSEITNKVIKDLIQLAHILP